MAGHKNIDLLVKHAGLSGKYVSYINSITSAILWTKAFVKKEKQHKIPFIFPRDLWREVQSTEFLYIRYYNVKTKFDYIETSFLN